MYEIFGAILVALGYFSIEIVSVLFDRHKLTKCCQVLSLRSIEVPLESERVTRSEITAIIRPRSDLVE